MSSSDKNKKYKKSASWKIHPENSDEDGLVNKGYEMEDYDTHSKNNQMEIRDKLHNAARKSLSQNNVINLIANIKAGTSRWRKYATTRRKTPSSESGNEGTDRRRTGGIGLDYEIGKQDAVDGSDVGDKTHREMVIACNRNLIEYFARLGQSKDEAECINLEYVESLLHNGAKIDCTDKYGQTIFHEVARAWHTDVAQFLLDHKGNIDMQDNFGRTPLHVAAAVDYPEMVSFLIKNNANREALTKGEKQTAVHFAARNDACNSLKSLIKDGALYKEVRDYKGRTPLHLAAELDRSETARLLLELDDPAPAGVEDNSGQAAIVWMIKKMPPVAKTALDQFHTTDRANRKQYYHLHRLEPQKPDAQTGENYPQTALEVTVQHQQYDIICHSAFSQLISHKWKKFGRLGAVLNTIVNLSFILLWSIQGILVEYDKRHIYTLPDQWWRILLFVLALLATVWQVKEELSEFFNSRKNHKRWCAWREKEIKRDMDHCHPRWPEEEQYLKNEIEELDKMSPQYFNDFWNIFDWICYALLLTCIITHLVDVFAHTNFVARLHIQIMAITVILIWLRLMKNARAFSALGPFIVILTYMLGDILKWACLYLEFYIPYACAFWMIFGGDKVPQEYQGRPDASNYTIVVSGYQDASALLFSLFRLTLVDDYDYDGMKQVDSVMADILVGTWLALSAIVMLNLFIALMSETFTRVYDNATANAVMQKAITILTIEEGLNRKRREKFRTFIHSHCAPEETFYDDDTTESGGEDLKKVTFQIKDQLEELEEALRDGRINLGIHGDSDHEDGGDGGNPGDGGDGGGGGGGAGGRKKRGVRVVTTQKFEKEMGVVKDELETMKAQQQYMMDRMKRDMGTMKSLLKQLVVSQMGSVDVPALDDDVASTFPRIPSLHGRPVTGPARRFGQFPPLDPSEDGTMEYRGTRPGTAVHGRTPHTGRRKDSLMGSARRAGGEALLDSTDDEWEKSEQKRKKDLEDLRRELSLKATAGGSTTMPEPIREEPDILTLDPPTTSSRPQADVGSQLPGRDTVDVPNVRVKSSLLGHQSHEDQMDEEESHSTADREDPRDDGSTSVA